MHIIGFSHHYTKIHGQTHGILLSARVLSEEEFKRLREDRCTIYYDSVFTEKDQELVRGIGDDERMQLVFIGNRQIPFTTYRKIPTGWHEKIHGAPYSSLLGQSFIFKFKGEELPRWLAHSVGPASVRIFE